jgi:hypothetical protein
MVASRQNVDYEGLVQYAKAEGADPADIARLRKQANDK